MTFDLTAYKALSFDIYATLIDWETGIYIALQPLLSRLPSSSPHHPSNSSPQDIRLHLLKEYHKHEFAIQREHPTMVYTKVLATIYPRIAESLGVEQPSVVEAKEFSYTIGCWPAFSDTVAAMKILGSHYKLIALSNVDKISFNNTLTGPLAGVKFDAIYTAEDIGSYKPDLRNFHYLIEHAEKDFGVKKDEILHTAQSLAFDLVPIRKVGMRPGVWIRRGGEHGGNAMGGVDVKGLTEKGELELAAEYETLGEMAEAVQKAFGDAK